MNDGLKLQQQQSACASSNIQITDTFSYFFSPILTTPPFQNPHLLNVFFCRVPGRPWV